MLPLFYREIESFAHGARHAGSSPPCDKFFPLVHINPYKSRGPRRDPQSAYYSFLPGLFAVHFFVNLTHHGMRHVLTSTEYRGGIVEERFAYEATLGGQPMEISMFCSLQITVVSWYPGTTEDRGMKRLVDLGGTREKSLESRCTLQPAPHPIALPRIPAFPTPIRLVVFSLLWSCFAIHNSELILNNSKYS